MYCSTSLIESSKREPVLWMAFTPLETSWQTSKRFIPCARARCILVGTHDELRRTGDCCVGCGARQKRKDGRSRAGVGAISGFALILVYLHCTPNQSERGLNTA